MNTKDQPAQASGDSEEAVREAIEELDRRIENAVGVRFHALTEARDLLRPTPALRPTPDHAAVVEALELCIDVMTWEHRQRDPKFKPEDATPESAIGRARTALSTMSKAPQAGGDDEWKAAYFGLREKIENIAMHEILRGGRTEDEIVQAVQRLADADAERQAEMREQIANDETTPSSRAEPVAWHCELARAIEHVKDEPPRYHDFKPHLGYDKPNVPEGSIRNLTPLYASPPSSRAEVVEAFIAGATAVHNEWVAAHDRDEGPPRGDPDFTEAASDYAAIRAIAQPAVGRDGTTSSSFPSKLTTGDRSDGASDGHIENAR